jgi:hypothetical protein
MAPAAERRAGTRDRSVQNRKEKIGMSSVANDESNRRLVDEIGQFTTIPYSFIQQSKGLSFHARWLFVVLRYYTNGKSGEAFPSYDTIQTLTGMRREMIAKSIRQLESRGWLSKRKRFNGSNCYTLNIPAPSAYGKERTPISDVREDGGQINEGGKTIPKRVIGSYRESLAELLRGNY